MGSFRDAESLEDLIAREAPLRFDDLDPLVTDVLHALHVLHERRIVYRALTPLTILLESRTDG